MAFYDNIIDDKIYIYLSQRNLQIAHFASMGATWTEIADCMGLSRNHVKNLAHKQGAYFARASNRPSIHADGNTGSGRRASPEHHEIQGLLKLQP